MGFKAHLAAHSPSLGLSAVRGRLRIPPGEVWLCQWSGPARQGPRELGLMQARTLKDQSSLLKQALCLSSGLRPALGPGPAKRLPPPPESRGRVKSGRGGILAKDPRGTKLGGSHNVNFGPG